MVTDQMLPQNAVSWEAYLSTRVSMHAWTKYSPIDATLTTAGTAQNLFLASTDIPTVNIVTNPSFETGDPPTGFTAVGSALSRSATIARNGTNSMLINPNNLAAGEGAYWTTPNMAGTLDTGKRGLYLVTSAYFNDNAGSSDTARIVIANSSGVTLVNGNTITLAAAWNRSQALYLLPNVGATYRVYMVTAANHNTNFYVDSLQVEIRIDSNTTTYCDGSLGIDYEWFGTAHASESRRKMPLTVVRGFNLHFTRDTYIAFNRTASSTTGVFVRAGSDWNSSWPKEFRHNYPPSAGQFISFINVNAGETPRVWGSVWGIAERGTE